MVSYKIFFLTISIFTFIFCFFKFDLISKYLNIFDLPDNKRKIHKKPVPKIGGIFFFLVFAISICQIFYFEDYKDVDNLNKILIPCFFFIVGIMDDKYDLSPNLRLIILTLGLILIIKIFSLPQIELLSIENYGIVNVKSFSLFFTVLCYLLFLNAFNMFDGINGLAISLFTRYVLLFLLLFNFQHLILINFLICCLIFLYFNIKEKIFLGNSGSYLLSGIISSSLISQNTDLENSFFAEEIFLILLIPGIDMLRLFIQRISKKKHPFNADKNHLHHILINNFNIYNVLGIILGLILLPIIARFYLETNTILLIFFSLAIYFFLILKYLPSDYISK